MNAKLLKLGFGVVVIAALIIVPMNSTATASISSASGR